MRSPATQAARTPTRREQAEATGLAGKPWEQEHSASAVAEATSYSCSNFPRRNDSRSSLTALRAPVCLARTPPERFAPKPASR